MPPCWFAQTSKECLYTTPNAPGLSNQKLIFQLALEDLSAKARILPLTHDRYGSARPSEQILGPPPIIADRWEYLGRPKTTVRNRKREHLTETEVERLIEAARGNRYGHRDATMILVAYRHGLRAGELVDLRWDQIDFNTATLHERRVKKGTPSTHPIRADELRALRRLQREQEQRSPFLFTSERGAPFTTAGFARMVERAGEAAKLSFKAHPHMLRHACGFKLANDGHDTRSLQAYLGHKNIQHTVRYTELAPTRFKDFFR
jgi:type 1 fimbriae regulatory protein FimB/type 1 fimbriae regulatory protein FimE